MGGEGRACFGPRDSGHDAEAWQGGACASGPRPLPGGASDRTRVESEWPMGKTFLDGRMLRYASLLVDE